MKDIHKHKQPWLIVVALMTILLSASAYSSEGGINSCSTTLLTAQENLRMIRQDVMSSVTQLQYKTAIERRYDVVEVLFADVTRCIKKEQAGGFETIQHVLKKLRADGRALVFSKFENWTMIKEEEIKLFHDVPEYQISSGKRHAKE